MGIIGRYRISLSVLVLLWLGAVSPLRLVAQSGSYAIPKTVISAGAAKQSGNWTIDGTIGQPVTGIASQTHVEGMFGFWYTVGTTLSSIPEDYVSLPGTVSLNVYPNPFSSEASIKVHLQQPSFLQISVSDITGSMVQILHEGEQHSSDASYTLSSGATGRANGIYYIRIRSLPLGAKAATVTTARVLLLR